MNYEIKSVLSMNLDFNIKSFNIKYTSTNTSQHKSTRVRHEKTWINASLTRVNTSPTRVNTSLTQARHKPTQINTSLTLFLHTLFQFGLTIAPIQNTGLINAKAGPARADFYYWQNVHEEQSYAFISKIYQFYQ